MVKPRAQDPSRCVECRVEGACSSRECHDDHIREECGLFGVFDHPEAPTLTYLGLYALQHRGQEGAGIVASDEGRLTAHRGLGLVADVFKQHKLARVRGAKAIGHVRYSTFGTSVLKNVQPLVVDYSRGSMAVCHNGNLVNAANLREDLENEGAIFQSTTDSEVIIHLVARGSRQRFADRVIEALKHVVGAYCILATDGEVIVAARDPFGFRPLWLGRLGGSYVLASETCALDIVNAEWVRELRPGEVVVVSDEGLESLMPFKPVVPKQCIFEFVYLARPDSNLFGRSVDTVRKQLGRNLAKDAPADADFVMAVPDSSNPAAMGYAHACGLPFDMGFIRNHYVGRTFIEPDQRIRDFGVKIKLNPTRSVIEGKRIVMIDDSIVRGTTSKKIIKMLRRCGAKEIHFRISSPPIVNSCYYGIDTPNQDRLIAANMSVEAIREYLDVDSLVYQSIEGLVDATGCNPEEFCLACFNNKYPTQIPADFGSGKVWLRHIDTSTELDAYERIPITSPLL